MPRHILIVFVSLAAMQLASVHARAADFPRKEGDLWVMADDSLTAQHLGDSCVEKDLRQPDGHRARPGRSSRTETQAW